MLAIMNYLEAM